MPRLNASHPTVLNLKAGEWVEVRSKAAILNTLDENGRLENLPFMPEMFQYCGRKLRVYKRADKTCDYIQGWSIRRLKDAVHLEAVRCDGSGHDGCQASCLMFWKEAWLKRADNNLVSLEDLNGLEVATSTNSVCRQNCVFSASKSTNSQGETTYICQTTDVPKFTSRMSFWDPRQYIRDLRSGNLDTGLADASRTHRVLEMVLAILRLLHATVIGFFNEVQERRRSSRYPFIEGSAGKTPVELLNLQPGELVEVRSKEEILATLDHSQRNRGLWFDSEMLPYCGGIYRVLRRVHRIVDERTGKMVNMKYPCIMLEGVVCKSDYHRLCPRAIYPYWRENWLKRASIVAAPHSAEQVAETCHSS
jgi:hypothetical protein